MSQQDGAETRALRSTPQPLQCSPPTNPRIVVYSLLISFSVLAVGFILQRLVYADWLHQSGPVHVVGTTIAAILTFIFVFHWQAGLRERQLETLRRFRVIAEMNDRIRNALQAIECLTYVSDQDATEGIRQAVGAIDDALRDVLAVSTSTAGTMPPPKRGSSTWQTDKQVTIPRSQAERALKHIN